MSKPLKTLASKLGVGGVLGLAALAPALAEDLKVAEFDFIRLQASIGAVEAPDVEEDSTDSNGTNTNYEWNGGRESGIQATITAMFGRAKLGEGGFEWGVELAFSNFNITPSDYTTNGSIANNGSTADLTHRTVGINLLGGWQWGLNDLDDFSGFVEIVPHVGGGVAFTQSEVFDNGTYVRDTGTGYYIEAGLRLGAYITEKRFIYGVNVSYAYAYSEADIQFSGGYDSELTLKRHGFGIAGVAGYRF
jgi:hypothetical protein